MFSSLVLVLCLFCVLDFHLVLEKYLNFFCRTLESLIDPALDTDIVGDMLALLVQVSSVF